METPLRTALSHFVGWASDRRIPKPLRKPVYRAYASFTGADLAEARLPLETHPCLGAFFVRHLVPGARPIDPDANAIVSPVDGTVQAVESVADGRTLQAKGRSYDVRDFLGPVGERFPFEGGTAWTLYLSPRDYHRIHAPEACRIQEAWWIQGARYSVAPTVLDRRLVLPLNERVALLLDTARGPLAFVLVGATNVGRMRVVGIDPEHAGHLERGPELARGEEMARFEMGSTVVLITPRGTAHGLDGLVPGTPVRLGRPIGRWVTPDA